MRFEGFPEAIEIGPCNSRLRTIKITLIIQSCYFLSWPYFRYYNFYLPTPSKIFSQDREDFGAKDSEQMTELSHGRTYKNIRVVRMHRSIENTKQSRRRDDISWRFHKS